jgi:nicotinate-nucleotide pyrophosphorylase (carboxylating)
MTSVSLPPLEVIRLDVQRALHEDIGDGDRTAALVPEGPAHAELLVRDAAVLSGIPWFDEVFRQLNQHVQITWLARDGETVRPGQILCRVEGPARALLTGERTALNFLQTLSGTATTVARYVAAVRGTRAHILDTRKTIPGLRQAQKYAVRCGGGLNHRMGLYDAILIKENHIAAAGSVRAALEQARRQTSPGLPVEIEVESLDQLREALDAGATRILLDNLDLEQMRTAVRLADQRASLEASGGITLDTIRAVAETGVDFISIGSLTKHVHAIDLSLRFQSVRV